MSTSNKADRLAEPTAEPPRGVTAISEAKAPKGETPPLLGTKSRKRGRRRGHQLSPERMQIVLDSLRKNPVLSHAARTAGIHPKTLAYWIKRSEAGDAGYDIVSEGIEWGFHEHCQTAMQAAHDLVVGQAWRMAMGGVVYKTDPDLLGLGCQGPDAYLRDEYGNPVPERIYRPNFKMVRLLLAWRYPEKWGKHPKREVPHHTGVLVVGKITQKPKNSSPASVAASVKARRWKAFAKKIDEAKS